MSTDMRTVPNDLTTRNKTRRSHVIPAFYLRSFADQRGRIWSLDMKTLKLFPTTPEKVATVRDYYRGDHAKHEDDLEKRLATVESNAAPHLKALIAADVDLPPDFARFVAWMMARTDWVRRLHAHFDFKRYYRENFEEFCKIDDGRKGRPLPLKFHNGLNEVVSVPFKDSRKYLESLDWELELSQDEFLDMIRMQAYCFETIHFPRLEWVSIRPPAGKRFITSDRPGSWDVLARGWQDFPAALKHPDVDLIFPVSPHIVLMAGHSQTSMLRSYITTRDVNNRIALRADRFLYAQEEVDLKSFLSRFEEK